jgi:DDE superfamily endonuclease
VPRCRCTSNSDLRVRLIRTHRREIGSVWRALNPGQQALLVLVYLRKGEPFAEVGTGFGVSTTTCWRHVNETVELLAARARAAVACPSHRMVAHRRSSPAIGSGSPASWPSSHRRTAGVRSSSTKPKRSRNWCSSRAGSSMAGS